MSCDDCKEPERGVYFMERACCVSRYISNTPGRERRRTLIEWYERTKGKAFADEVKETILKEWKK